VEGANAAHRHHPRQNLTRCPPTTPTCHGPRRRTIHDFPRLPCREITRTSALSPAGGARARLLRVEVLPRHRRYRPLRRQRSLTGQKQRSTPQPFARDVREPDASDHHRQPGASEKSMFGREEADRCSVSRVLVDFEKSRQSPPFDETINCAYPNNSISDKV
jgi:hypothetical protein